MGGLQVGCVCVCKNRCKSPGRGRSRPWVNQKAHASSSAGPPRAGVCAPGRSEEPRESVFPVEERAARYSL